MYYDFIHRHKNRAKAIGLVLLLVITWWGIATFIDRNGKVPVTISVVPNDAKVLFDATQKGNGTHYIAAGSYEVIVEKDGFKTDKKTVIITDKKQQNVVAISLNPDSKEAKKWAKDHESDYAKNQAYGAIEASSNGRYFTEKNPISSKLPFNDPYFTIGYVVNEDQTVTLTIVTPSPRYRFYAVQKIRDLGYNPTDFKIIFKDFKNPLERT